MDSANVNDNQSPQDVDEQLYDVEKLVDRQLDVENRWWFQVKFIGFPDLEWLREDYISEDIKQEFIEQQRKEGLEAKLGGVNRGDDHDRGGGSNGLGDEHEHIDAAAVCAHGDHREFFKDIKLEVFKEEEQAVFACNTNECNRVFKSEHALNVHKGRCHKAKEAIEKQKFKKLHQRALQLDHTIRKKQTGTKKSVSFIMNESRQGNIDDVPLESLKMPNPEDSTAMQAECDHRNQRFENAVNETLNDNGVEMEVMRLDVQINTPCFGNEPSPSSSSDTGANDDNGNGDHIKCKSLTVSVQQKGRQEHCKLKSSSSEPLGKRIKVEPGTEKKLDKVQVLRQNFTTVQQHVHDICEENIELNKLLEIQKRLRMLSSEKLKSSSEKIAELETKLENRDKENAKLKKELVESIRKRLELEEKLNAFQKIQSFIPGISTQWESFLDVLMTNSIQFGEQLKRLELVAKNPTEKQN